MVKPFPWALIAKLNVMVSKKPCAEKRGISKVAGLFAPLLLRPSAVRLGAGSPGKRF